MSGLFETLSARFSPGAQPAIRPRPQLRFEGGEDGQALREETAEIVARTPRSTPVPARNPIQAAPPAEKETPAAKARPAPLQSEKAAPSTPPETGKDSALSAAQRDNADRKFQSAKSDGSNRAKPGPDRPVASPHLQDPTPAETSTTHPPPEPASEPAPLTERIIETTVRELPPPSTEPSESPASAPVGRQSPGPAEKSEPPVIRIGRIEVTRPAPPAPSPAPAPARPEPPRRAAPATRARQPSGLTDYLGWKKR